MSYSDLIDEIIQGNPYNAERVTLNTLDHLNAELTSSAMMGLELILTLAKPMVFEVEEGSDGYIYLAPEEILFDVQIQMDGPDRKVYVIEERLGILEFENAAIDVEAPGTAGGMESLGDIFQTIYYMILDLVEKVEKREKAVREDRTYFLEVSNERNFRRAVAEWANGLHVSQDLGPLGEIPF